MSFRDYKKFPYEWMIAKGDVDDMVPIHKYGRNGAVAASEELIWSGSKAYLGFIDIPSTLSIASSNVADNGLVPGTGAWTISVFGLDSNYDPVYENIVLNGTTAVTTTTLWRRVFRAFVLTADESTPESGPNTGAISIRAADVAGTPVMAEIPALYGQTLMAIFTIPRNYLGLLTHLDATVGQGKEVTMSLKTRVLDENHEGPWLTKEIRAIYENSLQETFDVPVTVREKTDICITGISSVSTSVAATFDLLLFHGRNQMEDKDKFYHPA